VWHCRLPRKQQWASAARPWRRRYGYIRSDAKAEGLSRNGGISRDSGLSLGGPHRLRGAQVGSFGRASDRCGVFRFCALALGKVILIAKAFHFAEFRKDTPLIYPTLVKSAAFSVLLACFKILEDAGVGLYRGHSFTQSIADIGGGTLRGILSLTAIMFVVLIPFFAFTELGEHLGEGKLKQVFLHRRGTLNLPDRSAEALGSTFEQQSAKKQASA
jgi:hypothetical protein